MPEEPERPFLEWNTLQITEDNSLEVKARAAEEGKTLTDDEAFDIAAADEDIFRFEWENLTDELTVIMKELDTEASCFWYANVENFGWRSTSGHKAFLADDGRTLLQEILPKTPCVFKIFKREGCLAIQNFHHDSPMGKEFYYVYPTFRCQICEMTFPRQFLKIGKAELIDQKSQIELDLDDTQYTCQLCFEALLKDEKNRLDNIYAIILHDPKENMHTIIETGLTKEEATPRVATLRNKGLPAFHVGHYYYFEKFGTYPVIEE